MSRFPSLAGSLGLALLAGGLAAADRPTFCNPLDLPYRFIINSTVSSREAADPALVRFEGEYWLFASKCGGYWHTRDFRTWTMVETKDLPVEDYAPTVVEIDKRLYFTAGSKVFRADDVRAGRWTQVGEIKGPSADRDLFCDDDGRVYLYSGCSNKDPITVRELDPKNGFKNIGETVVCITADTIHHGFEMPGDENEGKAPNAKGEVDNRPWNEGAWMTKRNGRYYLQYASPGTQFRSYADGVYVADKPLGPFTYAPYSPFSHKSDGFLPSAGHSCTFQDNAGNYWHIVTALVGRRQSFERRLAIYPMTFTADGQMVCNTMLGDLPQFTPDSGAFSVFANQPGWMELAGGKAVTASSSAEDHPATNAVNEDIRSWWSAESGNPGEWLAVDLGKPCRINAFQLNFADDSAIFFGRVADHAYRYVVETSLDGITWTMALDRRDTTREAPHDYAALPAPITARRVRITNQHTPAGMRFSLYDLRVFGSDLGAAPAQVSGVTAIRDAADGRHMTVKWDAVPGAKGYLVRYGLAADRLFDHRQVIKATTIQINSLNTGVGYALTVDAYNDNGVTAGTTIIPVP